MTCFLPKFVGRLLRVAALAGLCSLVDACVVLGKKDAFPVAGSPRPLSSLQALASPGGTVSSLRVSADGHPVTAFYVRHPGARGVLIFLGGSGNEIEAPIKGLGHRTEALGLDLVVFSYYQQGAAIPTVAQVRAEAHAVYDAVKATHAPASRSIYLLGHSLGGWFALDLAASEDNVHGLALTGAETTPAEVIRRTYSPWADLVALRPDADARQLDASLYAPRVHARTLVVTSRQDEAVPSAVGQELFEMLPVTTPKRFVVLDGVTHGRYFLSDEFWRQFADFFGLHVSSATPHG